MSLRQQCLPIPIGRKRPVSPSEEIQEEAESIDALASMDASTYLASVRDQASRMPNVFVASTSAQIQTTHNNLNTDAIDGSVASLNYLLSDRLKIHPPPSSAHVPHNLSSWVRQTLNNFSILRVYLHQSYLVLRECERVKVPKSKDRYAWHVFCVGKAEAMGNAFDNYDHSDEEDDDEDEEEDNSVLIQDAESEYHVPMTGFDPNTKLISQFDDILVRRVISHHLHYIKEGYDISFTRGRWLYGLLGRLQKPLHRDEASLLMDLLRELCMIRKRSNGGEESLKIVNTLIVIIGVYFEQCCNIDVLMKPLKIDE
jgi:hypothetical protein